MQAPIAGEIWLCWSFGRLSGFPPSAWILAWSWDPLRFGRRHPSHRLSPARAKHPSRAKPRNRLRRSRSPQQRSHRARMPVNSEQDSCSFSRIILTQKRSIGGKSARLWGRQFIVPCSCRACRRSGSRSRECSATDRAPVAQALAFESPKLRFPCEPTWLFQGDRGA